MNAFESCELLVRKHAPLFMRVGDEDGIGSGRVRLSPALAAKRYQTIHKLKSQGMGATAIARKLNVGMGTVNHYLHDPRCKAHLT